MRATRPSRRRPAAKAGTLMLILLLLAAAAPAVTRADVGQTIILRCTHRQSLAGFKQADYRRALKEISATTEEYSGCGQEIRQAMEAAAGGRGGGGAAGGAGQAPVPLATTPAERTSLARAANGAGGAPVRLAGGLVRPGVVHANVASAFSTLPGSLLAVLGVLLALALTGCGLFANRRFSAFNRLLRRRSGGSAG